MKVNVDLVASETFHRFGIKRFGVGDDLRKRLRDRRRVTRRDDNVHVPDHLEPAANASADLRVVDGINVGQSLTNLFADLDADRQQEV